MLGGLGGHRVFVTGDSNASVSVDRKARRRLFRTFSASDGGEKSDKNRQGLTYLNAVDQI